MVPDIVNISDVFCDWYRGWIIWSVIYYVSGLLVIVLPAIVASDILPDRTRRLIATAAAIVAGVVTWVEPGTRATAHERAYLCLKVALVEFAHNETAFRERFPLCAAHINYNYVNKPGPRDEK